MFGKEENKYTKKEVDNNMEDLRSSHPSPIDFSELSASR